MVAICVTERVMSQHETVFLECLKKRLIISECNCNTYSQRLQIVKI
jgi:hypothetical protein